jgi:F-box interacting protein
MEDFSNPPVVYPRQFPLLMVPLARRIFRYVHALLYGPVRCDGPMMNQPCLVGQPRSATTDEAKNVNGGALGLATLPCRGLVVLTDCKTEINYLCNPSTGQMAALPQDQKKERKMCHEEVQNQHYECLGLGYDFHSKKHKVVRILYQGSDLHGLPRSVRCEVYVVNSTGCWQPIRDKPPAWIKYKGPGVCVRGHVNWLAQRKLNTFDMVIVSFSLADHKFGTMAPPLGMETESLYMHELTELDGQLCLFPSYVWQSSRYDIWLLSEHGEREWNLRCRIDMSKVSPDITDRFLRCRFHPLAIIDNGSRILLAQPRGAYTDKYSRLCAYDPVTGEVEDIYSGSGMVYDIIFGTIDAAVYEESTISFR